MSAIPVNVHGVYKWCWGASMLATVRVRIGVHVHDQQPQSSVIPVVIVMTGALPLIVPGRAGLN